MTSRRRRFLRIGLGLLGLGCAGVWALDVPSFGVPYSTVVYDRDGQLLGASIAQDGQWRFPSSGSQVPDRYRTALLTFEDRHFDIHPGIDPLAVLRAVWLNVRHQRVVSGASTLTMQVVRMSRAGAPRTLAEKVVEAGYALRLELAHSKNEILAQYASHAPFGGNAVGLEAATWRYFGRPPENLTWAEAATLAVLPNSPALIHPGRNRRELRDKRDRLLARLHDEGHLDEETLTLARLEPLPDNPRPLPQLAPHILAHMQGRGIPRATTTLDHELMRRSREVVGRHQKRLAENGVHNLGTLVLDNETGAILAYHGNVLVDGAHEDYVDVARAPRSTGSLLKPFLYEALLGSGELLPSELVVDIPLRIGGFAPQNFDRSFDGAVPAGEALSRSLNVPATSLLRDLGVPGFMARLRSLGMTTLTQSPGHYGLSLVLGGSEGSLLELTGMYASLARAADGRRAALLKPHLLPSERRDPGEVALRPDSAYLTLSALEGVKRPGVDGSWRQFPTSRRVAWKTGTSFGFRDGWAIGITPEFTVGVWAGNADGEGRPGLTGHRAAAPVLFELFELLPRPSGGRGWFRQPAELVGVEVCADSGMRAGPNCPRAAADLVPQAAAQSEPCRYCRAVFTDRQGARVHSDCASVHDMQKQSWFVLPPRQEVHFRRHRPSYRPLPPWRADCRATLPAGDVASSPLALITPKPHTQLVVPRELNGRSGRAVFEAAHRDHLVDVHWHLDEVFLGTTREIHQMEVAPPPGDHHLTLVDANGAIVERSFSVLDVARPTALTY